MITSTEIAKIAGKEHFHVLRDMRSGSLKSLKFSRHMIPSTVSGQLYAQYSTPKAEFKELAKKIGYGATKNDQHCKSLLGKLKNIMNWVMMK